MTDKRGYSRRRVLATLAAVGVAGCTDAGDGPGETDQSTIAGTQTRTETSERTTSGAAPTTATSEPTTREPTATPGETTTPSPVKRTTDVVFRETPQGTLKLDLYQPRSGDDHPFFVFAHGGGWVFGDKHERPMFNELALEGYSVADIQYRLAGAKKYPAAVRDVVAAIKWVRDNADSYGIDASRGGLGGYSAGAHLAALVGVAPDHENFQPVDFKPGVSADVDAIVGYSGPYDFTVPGASENQLVQNFFGEDASDETLREGSPVTHVDSDDPPALLLHGTEDGTVPYRSTTVLADAFRNADVPVEVFTGEGVGHGMIDDPEWREKTLPKQKAFLRSELDPE